MKGSSQRCVCREHTRVLFVDERFFFFDFSVRRRFWRGPVGWAFDGYMGAMKGCIMMGYGYIIKP